LKIRNKCGYENYDFIASLSPSINIKQIQNTRLGDGSSGSFSFFSEDKKFIIKTMTETKVERIRSKLKTYLEHILTTDSIMAKILGIFKIKIDRFSPIFVMIMENTMPNI
jgi:hypothetical protein